MIQILMKYVKKFFKNLKKEYENFKKKLLEKSKSEKILKKIKESWYT